MINIGQIYKKDKQILCVTSILGSISGLLCNTIDTNGFIYKNFYKDFEKDKKLIAEYPTWHEAVNSPEFKGKRNDRI